KASAAWSHRFGDALTATLGAQGSQVRDSYHYVDRNLRDTPSFRLAAEGGRGVWVPAATIPAATGVTDVRNASRVPAFARVVAFESGASAHQAALTGELAFRARRRVTGT